MPVCACVCLCYPGRVEDVQTCRTIWKKSDVRVVFEKYSEHHDHCFIDHCGAFDKNFNNWDDCMISIVIDNP